MLKKTIFAAAAAIALSATAFAASAADQVAVFAGGCFWSMQKAFDHVPGVVKTRAGFMGGHVKNPTYEQVVTETTGHVESVEVTYDPARVSYDQLLDAFWRHTDPTDPNGVICDFGPSYRTAIFTYNDDQYARAVASKQAAARQLHKPVVTLIVKSTATGLPFYPASDYHQHFWQTHAAHYDAYYQGCGRGPALHKLWGALADS